MYGRLSGIMNGSEDVEVDSIVVVVFGGSVVVEISFGFIVLIVNRGKDFIFIIQAGKVGLVIDSTSL